RVPQTPSLDRVEALVELTRRYFMSRGPATLKDYLRWSSLTAAMGSGASKWSAHFCNGKSSMAVPTGSHNLNRAPGRRHPRKGWRLGGPRGGIVGWLCPGILGAPEASECAGAARDAGHRLGPFRRNRRRRSLSGGYRYYDFDDI